MYLGFSGLVCVWLPLLCAWVCVCSPLYAVIFKEHIRVASGITVRLPIELMFYLPRNVNVFSLRLSYAWCINYTHTFSSAYLVFSINVRQTHNNIRHMVIQNRRVAQCCYFLLHAFICCCIDYVLRGVLYLINSKSRCNFLECVSCANSKEITLWINHDSHRIFARFHQIHPVQRLAATGFGKASKGTLHIRRKPLKFRITCTQNKHILSVRHMFCNGICFRFAII